MNKLIQRFAKSSLGAMFGMVPSWALYGALALSLVMAGGYLNGLRWSAKYDKHVLNDMTSVAQSLAAQALLNQAASIEYAQAVSDVKIKVEVRTKEVKIYVEKNNRLSVDAGMDCRVDADFVSVYNGTSAAAKAAD